jgi:hypothetical protein
MGDEMTGVPMESRCLLCLNKLLLTSIHIVDEDDSDEYFPDDVPRQSR